MKITIEGTLAKPAEWGRVAGKPDQGVLVVTLRPDGSWGEVEVRQRMDDGTLGPDTARRLTRDLQVRVVARRVWPRTTHSTFATVIEDVESIEAMGG